MYLALYNQAEDKSPCLKELAIQVRLTIWPRDLVRLVLEAEKGELASQYRAIGGKDDKGN